MAIQSEMKFPMELEYGDFGCADPEVERRTEQDRYNVKIMMWVTKDTAAEVYNDYTVLYSVQDISFI